MKTHTLSISTLSVLCVLCAGLATNAMAAGTVRSLGGAGTYDGTAAASTATSSVTRAPAARSGSLRISPSSARLITTNNNSASTSGGTRATSSGTSQRLSIGKYLGGATTTPTTTSGEGGETTPGSSTSYNTRITQLEQIVIDGDENLVERVEVLEGAQPHSSADGIVIVAADGEVSVDVDALIDALNESGEISSSRETAIQYTEDGKLQWRYTSGDNTEWQTLFDVNDLTGDYMTADDVDDAITEALATYATKSELETLAARVEEIDAVAGGVDNKQPKSTAAYQVGAAGGTWSTLTPAQIAALESGVTTSVVEQVATNAEDIETISGAIDELTGTGGTISGLVAKTDIDDALSTTSENPVQNKVVTNAMPNYDTTGNTLLEPGELGAYVLGVVDGQRAYIAVVDGNGETGKRVTPQQP